MTSAARRQIIDGGGAPINNGIGVGAHKLSAAARRTALMYIHC